MTEHPYLRRWLMGTTCHRRERSVLLESDTHIVMKHHSHSEYVGGGIRSATCTVYAKLYRKEDVDPSKPWGGLANRDTPLYTWEGRNSLQVIREDCADFFKLKFP